MRELANTINTQKKIGILVLLNSILMRELANNGSSKNKNWHFTPFKLNFNERGSQHWKHSKKNWHFSPFKLNFNERTSQRKTL